MKTTEIRDLINCIAQSGLGEVHIKMEGIKLHVKRNMLTASHTASDSLSSAMLPLPLPQIDTSVTVEASRRYTTMRSPLVGTFYRAPDPKALPFVQEGDMLTQGKKVCIIEAMKLYNEIEADVTGKIVKILADDASPVEYDQPLFLIDPT